MSELEMKNEYVFVDKETFDEEFHNELVQSYRNNNLVIEECSPEAAYKKFMQHLTNSKDGCEPKLIQDLKTKTYLIIKNN
jgi:hypothetical protein